jgi:uncharacterized membrane protein
MLLTKPPGWAILVALFDRSERGHLPGIQRDIGLRALPPAGIKRGGTSMATATPEKKKTSMGMEENVAGFLSYLGFIVTGLIFYFSEKENKNVRFHALQSIAFTVVFTAVYISFLIISVIFNAIGAPIVSSILMFLLWVAVVIVWIILMVQAFGGKKFKLPIIGDFCEKQVK